MAIVYYNVGCYSTKFLNDLADRVVLSHFTLLQMLTHVIKTVATREQLNVKLMQVASHPLAMNVSASMVMSGMGHIAQVSSCMQVN